MTQVHQPAFWPFLVKRFCRIYLPFAAVTLIIAAAYAVIPTAPSPYVSDWLNSLPKSWGEYSLAGHLLMTGRSQDMVLNVVMWTLVHEIRMSMILPALFFFIRRFGAAQTVIACLAVSAVASVDMTSSIIGSWQATLHFAWMFAAGSALAYHRDNLAGAIIRCDFKTITALWLVTLTALIVPFDRAWADFVIGGGACLLIVLCLPDCAVSRALTMSVPLWFGRVSYSLYLIHLPILVLATTGGFVAGASFKTFVLTLVVAELAYRTLEAPAHRLGVTLSQSIRKARQPA